MTCEPTGCLLDLDHNERRINRCYHYSSRRTGRAGVGGHRTDSPKYEDSKGRKDEQQPSMINMPPQATTCSTIHHVGAPTTWVGSECAVVVCNMRALPQEKL